MSRKTKYPLRKVTGRVIGKPWLVILECGHTMCASTQTTTRTSIKMAALGKQKQAYGSTWKILSASERREKGFLK